MSKLKVNTEEKIVSKALEMFNEQGIEYVGMRELAGILEMRVSNITYYFPTKDDLVNRLSLDLRKLNSQTIIEHTHLTLETFLNTYQTVFRNQIQYRCLLLSFVHLMKQNKKMALRYKKTERNRYDTLRSNIKTLEKSGYLKIDSEKEVEYLVHTIALIARFWISEATVSYNHLTPEKQISRYITIIGRLLMPFVTIKEKKNLIKFLKELSEEKN